LDGQVDPNYRTSIPEWEYLDYPTDADTSSIKPGHLRHMLTISVPWDGYEVMLNPLVRQPNGEWELWDFGTKTAGAYRYRSFEALLEYGASHPAKFQGTPPEVDVDAALLVLDAPDATDQERALAIHQLWLTGTSGERHPRYFLEARRLALDTSADPLIRSNQARMLALFREADVELLLQLVRDPEPPVWKSVVSSLAALDDPRAREATLVVLTDPDLDPWIVGSLWRGDPTDVMWEAYQQTGNLDLLGQLGSNGHTAGQRELVKRLADPTVPASRRSELAQSLRRPSADLADGLVRAASLDGAPLGVIGSRLAEIDPKRAVPILHRVFRDPNEASWTGEAAVRLGDIGSDAARDALIDVIDEDLRFPQVVIEALGRFPDPAATRAVASKAPDNELLLKVIYALENQAIPEARVALGALDHVQALRALARLGDEYALTQLLTLASSSDAELQREALEGLRELSHPRSTDVLTKVGRSADADSDAAAICAHALAVINAEAAIPFLNDLLGLSDNQHLQRVVQNWLEQLATG
jgi:HEAT repeat protein